MVRQPVVYADFRVDGAEEPHFLICFVWIVNQIVIITAESLSEYQHGVVLPLFSCGIAVFELGLPAGLELAEHDLSVADLDHRSTRIGPSFVVLAVAAAAAMPGIAAFNNPTLSDRREALAPFRSLLDFDLPPGTLLD